MKKLLTYIILIPVITVFLPSCHKILFDDEVKTRMIQTGDFHAISVSGIYGITLIQDSAEYIEITGSNNIGAVEATVKGDTLVIDDHKSITLNPVKNSIQIHFKSVSYLVTHDPVSIVSSDTIRGEEFSYDAIGELAEANLSFNVGYLVLVNSANTLGQFTLSGRASVFSCFNRYGSAVFAGELSCSYATITNESVGDVYIKSSDFIKVFIWGPGNIYYFGNPAVEIAGKKGEGRLIKLD